MLHPGKFATMITFTGFRWQKSPHPQPLLGRGSKMAGSIGCAAAE